MSILLDYIIQIIESNRSNKVISINREAFVKIIEIKMKKKKRDFDKNNFDFSRVKILFKNKKSKKNHDGNHDHCDLCKKAIQELN